jgi:hypothetical protein
MRIRGGAGAEQGGGQDQEAGSAVQSGSVHVSLSFCGGGKTFNRLYSRLVHLAKKSQ